MDKSNLKIQFRAVPYGSDAHVLEYRVDLDQDLTYQKEIKILGLFKKKVTRKYDTSWIKPLRYFNHLSSYLYDEKDDNNWFPFFIKNQKELDWYKDEFKTIGEFLEYQKEVSDKDYNEWKQVREEYLNRNRIMY